MKNLHLVPLPFTLTQLLPAAQSASVGTATYRTGRTAITVGKVYARPDGAFDLVFQACPPVDAAGVCVLSVVFHDTFKGPALAEQWLPFCLVPTGEAELTFLNTGSCRPVPSTLVPGRAWMDVHLSGGLVQTSDGFACTTLYPGRLYSQGRAAATSTVRQYRSLVPGPVRVASEPRVWPSSLDGHAAFTQRLARAGRSLGALCTQVTRTFPRFAGGLDVALRR